MYFRLVLETMNGLNKDRRCWRMIGGVLVEKNVELLMPDITLEIDNVYISFNGYSFLLDE